MHLGEYAHLVVEAGLSQVTKMLALVSVGWVVSVPIRTGAPAPLPSAS
jgi:hypothetical protein